jgi:hypothetical protein
VARLYTEVGAGVPARLPWIEAWHETHRGWRPWVVAVPDDGHELRAVAPLGLRSRAGILQLRFLSDHCPVACRSAQDGRELARALARALQALRRPWSLHLGQLTAGNPFASELVRVLDDAEISPGADCPIVALGGTPATSSVLSRNLRKAEARARNRIARANLEFEVRWLTDPASITARVGHLRSVHRARDLQLRGASPLDVPEGSAFYEALLRRHLAELELLEVRLAGELAAYLLWVRDGAERYVLDNRVAPRWTAYSAGLIANNVALRTAAADPQISVLDWGPGLQRYKLQSASRVIQCVQLDAWSSPAVQRLMAGARWARGLKARPDLG